MFCRKCGKEIPDDSLFCPKCGTPTNENSTPPDEDREPDKNAFALTYEFRSSYNSTQNNKTAVGSNSPVHKISASTKRNNKADTASNSTAKNYKTDLSPVMLNLSASSNQSDDAFERLLSPISDQEKLAKKKIALTILKGVIVAIVVVIIIVFFNSLHLEFNYFLNSDGTYTITRYVGNGDNVVIPDKRLGIPVTRIGDRAFFYADIDTVTIGSNVKVIEGYAFAYSSVKTVTFQPRALDTSEIGIQAFAFFKCENLSEFNFPDNISLNIEPGAFDDCYNIPDNLKDLL